MKIITLIFSLILSITSHAQMTGEQIAAKTKIEKNLRDNIHSKIATVLPKDTFTVGVDAQIEIIQKSIEKKSSEKQVVENELDIINSEISVGLINAKSIIDDYKQELENERRKSSISLSEREELLDSQIKVNEVFVYVGLDEDLGQDYKNTFGQWLKKNLKSKYGNIAKSEVNFLRKKIIKEKETPKLPEKTIWDHLKSLQIMIGLLALAFVGFIAMLLSKFMVSRDILEQQKMAHNVSSQQSTQALAALEDSAKEEANTPKQDQTAEQEKVNFLYEDRIQKIKNKILIMAGSMNDQIDDLLKIWLDSGPKGQIKVACYLDIFNEKNSSLSEINTSAKNYFFIPDQYKNEMNQVFESMPKMSLKDKYDIFNELYWSFISTQSLGIGYLDKPFRAVNSLPFERVDQIINQQNPQVKAVALLYLNDNLRKQYMNSLNFESKKEIITSSFKQTEINHFELSTLSDSFAVLATQNTTAKNESVDIFPLIPQLLNSLSPYDEIILLREIGQKNPKEINRLMQFHMSLAFIEKWSEQAIATLVGKASNEDLIALIRIIPSQADRIISLAPSLTASILTDELSVPDNLSLETKNRALVNLKNILNNLLETNEIEKAKIYEGQVYLAAA